MAPGARCVRWCPPPPFLDRELLMLCHTHWMCYNSNASFWSHDIDCSVHPGEESSSVALLKVSPFFPLRKKYFSWEFFLIWCERSKGQGCRTCTDYKARCNLWYWAVQNKLNWMSADAHKPVCPVYFSEVWLSSSRSTKRDDRVNVLWIFVHIFAALRCSVCFALASRTREFSIKRSGCTHTHTHTHYWEAGRVEMKCHITPPIPWRWLQCLPEQLAPSGGVRTIYCRLHNSHSSYPAHN